MSDAYNVWRVLRRMEDTRIITEDGVYAEDQVPEDYGGFELKVKFCQRMLLANNAGQLMELRFDTSEDVMDKDGKVGMGIVFDYDFAATPYQEQAPAVGPSAEFMITYTSDWHYLSYDQEQRALKMFEHMRVDEGD